MLLASRLLENNKIDEAEHETQETLKVYNNLTFPQTKTPIEDYYETFTSRYPEFKEKIDYLFSKINQKRK